MIEFGGSIYYIDLDALEKAIKPIGIDPMDKVIDREEKAYLDADGKITGSEITFAVMMVREKLESVSMIVNVSK